jgi:hypothetical protein
LTTHKKNYKKSNIQKKSQISIYAVVPLLLILALVPLIIYIKQTKINAVENLFMGINNTQTDMFSYYKMVWFLVFSAASLIPLLFIRDINLLEKDRRIYYIPAGIYTLLILISSIASEYKTTAFLGFWGRYEGAVVLIAYIAVMFSAMNMLKEEKHIKILFICLFSSAAVVSILGALQLVGIDYFNTKFVLDLITPMKLKELGGKMQMTFGKGTLFSTLYNPDYVGSYMAMLMPVIIVAIVYLKKIPYKLLTTALLCLVILNWIGCDSLAGVFGGVGSLIIILIMFRKKIMHHKVIALSIVVLLCGGLVIMNFAANGSITNKLKGLTSILEKDHETESQKTLAKILQGLVDVSLDSERAKIVTDKGIFQIKIIDKKLSISDGDNKEIATSVSGNSISISDSRFQNIKLTTKPEEGLIEIYYNDFNLIGVVLTKEGLVSSTNRWMTFRGDKSIAAFGFKGYETFATNRGYIWSRTIPLIKNSFLLGYGPDTFPIYFPQYDYIGKLKYYETGGMFVDKAHNMYLQTAMNSGVISLLALLALFGVYFITSIKIYIREKFESFLPFAGLACFAAFVGYAVAGLANDSVISVAPVFWVLLGLGIGINLRLAKEKAIQPITANKTRNVLTDSMKERKT